MNLAKESIRKLEEYTTNEVFCEIKLDANEGKNIFKDIFLDNKLNINFYPDNNAYELKKEISNYLNISSSNITVGNGSSELIDIIIKTFVDKNEIILSTTPTFSMYSVYSQIHSCNFIGIESDKDFSINVNNLIEKSKEVNSKLIFLCNPNNPTGCLIDKKDIKKLLENTNSIVVVDEAYIEFGGNSMIDEVLNYDNLIVLRTLSKAFGLAGIRVGYMISNINIVNLINKVRSPYNLNSLSQYIAINALKNKDRVLEYAEIVKKERDFIYGELNKMGVKTYKSYGNFLFFNSDINNLYENLINKGVLIRNYSGDLKGYYRVTVGDEYENKLFIKGMKEIVQNENS